ncbi:unnamed protein product [Musa banksii]
MIIYLRFGEEEINREATPDLHFGGRDWAEFGSPSLCFLRAGLRRGTPTTEDVRRGEEHPALLLCYEGRSIIYESPADEPCAAGVCGCAGNPQKL